MSLDDLSTEQKVGLLGAAAVVVGAFLPWFEASVLGTTVSETGIDRDGWFTLILAVVAGGVLMYDDWGKSHQLVVFIIGFVIGGLAALYAVDPFVFGYEGPGAQEDLARSAVSAATGLYVTLLGGLAILFAGVVSLNDALVDDMTSGRPQTNE